MGKLNSKEYKQIFYIDNYGDDNNNGTKEYPYKTIKGLLFNINTKIDTLIYLGKGEFEIDETIFNKCNNCKFSIHGKNKDTILKQIKGFFSNSGGGNETFTCNFYDLIYTAPNVENPNANYVYSKCNFYNIAFKDIANNGYSFFYSVNEINFYNCIKTKISNNFLRTTDGKINLYNCYGAFTSGYSTNQSSWDKKDNLITDNPKLNNRYKIIGEGNSIYGVYSGDNSWQLSRYLLKQDNQYYSIESEFYDKEKRTYLPCERDFDKNGIDDLHQLTTNIEINNEVFNPIMKFKGEIELIQAEEK